MKRLVIYLHGVAGIANDIIVFGFKEDRSDHDSNLKAVMERGSRNRCQVQSREMLDVLNCLSLDIASASGLKMNTRKTQAIVNMDPSKIRPPDVPWHDPVS